ncbi:GntR family transcriptional regulator [Paenarthrobacter sp. AB444]|uniref:GntR family transcriptional regulator n=1 Tax=Paenarthrobacter sp. AB444 TaxID=3025681 RepID=UPI002365089B|nr:GntR family transcriptional regulator [Paenarthrobacter sp. AB444]MDD7833834.1 GntR family transcriptional regulator [Paenarthrobacter sp. AB444]
MERAYAEIKKQVMTLELAPGAVVDDMQISERLGISRTPAREALFRLASEGLIVADPGKSGFSVKPMDLLDISNLFEAHMVAARAIGRLLAVRATPADIAKLRRAEAKVVKAIERQRPVEVASTNAELHRLEATSTRNGYLGTMACSIHDQGQRLGYLAFGGATSWDSLHDHFLLIQRDHAELIDAYEAGDPDAAESVAARHVVLFRDRILSFLTESATGPMSLGGDILPSIRLDGAHAK